MNSMAGSLFDRSAGAPGDERELDKRQGDNGCDGDVTHS